jgi:hypothetical protein
VVQNPPRSDFPASHTPTQNSTPQTTPNNELFHLQARRDEQEPEAAAQATFNKQQAASTSPARDTIGGERFANTENASYPRQPITAGEVVSQRVGNTMNHARGTESNNDQNSDREAGQWQGLGECLLKITPASLIDHTTGPSQAEGSQAANALLSQLFPNTEGINDFRPSSASLSQTRDFSASNLNSAGDQTSSFDSPLMPNTNIQDARMPATDPSMPFLNCLGAQMPSTNYLGPQMPCLNSLGAEMPWANYLGPQMPCLNSLGAEMPCANCLGAQMPSFTDLSTAAGMHSYST